MLRSRCRSRDRTNASAEPKTATVTLNSAASLDESLRLLTLSVADPVEYLEGRRMAPKPSQPRWLEAYTSPGQKVRLTDASGHRLMAVLACSPIDIRKDSALLDASIVDVVLESDDGQIFMAEPGSEIQISVPMGTGFANPVNRNMTLTTALEEERPLVFFVADGQGIAATRAAMQWDPVQAAATQRPVAVVYIAMSPQAAAFMAEWDEWRAYGVTVLPLYVQQGPGSSAARASMDRVSIQASSGGSVDGVGTLDGGGDDCALLPREDRVILHLEELLTEDGKLPRLLGRHLDDAVALFAGLQPWQSKTLLQLLATHGIHSDRVLYI